MKLNNSCDGIYDSIDIRFTKDCDNNCKFCIEHKGLDSLGKTNVSALIQATIQSGIREVLVLGGEPFLYPKELLKYVVGIRDSVDKIYITTALPKTFVTQSKIIKSIISIIDGLNISIQSVDYKENIAILNTNHKHDRVKILEHLNIKYSNKIRTSINLVKGGIDTGNKLLYTLKYLENIGCKQVKINELQDSPDYVSYEDLMGYKLPSPYYNGCQTIIKQKIYTMKIILKRSCFLVEESRKASFMDLIKVVYKRFFYRPTNKFKVLYENGI